MKRFIVFLIISFLFLLSLCGCVDGTSTYPESTTIIAVAEEADNPNQPSSLNMEKQKIYSQTSEVVEMFLDIPIFAEINEDSIVEIYLTNINETLSLCMANSDFTHCIDLADLPAGYLINAYYINTFDGYSFVVVSFDYCSDDFETKVVSLSDFEPEEIFSLPLYAKQVDEFGFEAYGYLQAAGTWAVGTHAYFINNDVEWRGTYVLDKEGPSFTKLQTASELPVQMLIDDRYAESSVPAGTVLSFSETDGTSYMTFVLDDGSEGKLNFERNDNGFEMIDGKPVDEYFFDLPQFG